LSHNFPIQNGLKKGDALSLLLFNFALEYAIREFQGKLAYADDVNLLGGGGNMGTMKSTKSLISASKEVSPEANADKSKQMFLTRLQDGEQILLHFNHPDYFHGYLNLYENIAQYFSYLVPCTWAGHVAQMDIRWMRVGC
jgi:hypothetical protein